MNIAELMSLSDEELKKADLSVSDLTSSGGLMNATQSDTFLAELIERPRLTRLVQVVPMKARQANVEKIGFTSRILHVASEGTALSSSNRSKPDTTKVTLTTKEYKASIRLSYETLQASIESDAPSARSVGLNFGPPGFGSRFSQTILARAIDGVARDIEHFAIQGDTTSSDADLAAQDGFLKLATTHTYSHSSARANSTLFRRMLAEIPDEYLDVVQYAFFVHPQVDIDWRWTQHDRGGTTLTEADAEWKKNAATAFGIPLVPVSLMPSTQGASSINSSALLTAPKNMVVGVHRDFYVDFDKDVDTSEVKMVISLSMAFQYETEAAVCKATDIQTLYA